MGAVSLPPSCSGCFPSLHWVPSSPRVPAPFSLGGGRDVRHLLCVPLMLPTRYSGLFIGTIWNEFCFLPKS